MTLYGSGTINGTSYTISSPVLLKIKESGTAPIIGAKFNYAANDDLDFKFRLDYVSGVGGGGLVEADLTIWCCCKVLMQAKLCEAAAQATKYLAGAATAKQ